MGRAFLLSAALFASTAVACNPGCMSRGPSRRVAKLLDAGLVGDAELRAADHEADLLGHPYVGIEHLELAKVKLAGRRAELLERRRLMTPGMPLRGWRPRGPRSALRRAGRLQTEVAQGAARAREADVRPGDLSALRHRRRPASVAGWLGGISLVLWAGSWYLVWKEIFVWRHMTKSLRFQVPDLPPDVHVAPRPGLPVIILRAVAILAPVVAVAGLGLARRRAGGRASSREVGNRR